ncbi:hypothetical protein [Algibacter sp. 2305UL17-15]|uniref:hypothetical protein n=1 Tax=Algibacter sp. 2305UL17-15 TaxID=3231268 RepID=UPI0034575FBE
MPLPAPHGHCYQAYDNFDFKYINVFCTPRNKRFLYSDGAHLDIEFCSKTIAGNRCGMMTYDTHFDHELYIKDVRISDKKFHKLFLNDTLIVTDKTNSKEYLFLPVEK